MPFDSGRVSFARFRVAFADPDKAPAAEAALAKLAEFAFKEGDIGAPAEVESGWTAGAHLFDTQFSYDKNGFGDLLLFALRIDVNKAPAEVRKAYKLLHVQAAAANNPSGFASKAQKKDASDQAERIIHDELASGKHKRSKAVPVVMELARREVYVAAAGNTVLEQLASKFRETFDAELEPLTSGALAGEWLRDAGRTRDYDDLSPSPFTPPPAMAREDHQDASGPEDTSTPNTPWMSPNGSTKDWLGNEFVLWLWRQAEMNEGLVPVASRTGKNSEVGVMFDRSLDMDCAWGVGGKMTLRGSGPTRMGEAAEALSTGKWPRKVGLTVADGDQQWEFTLQADRFLVGGASLPAPESAESPRELIESRLTSVTRLAELLDGLFTAFLKQRTATGWPGQREAVRDWIKSRRRRRAVAAVAV